MKKSRVILVDEKDKALGEEDILKAHLGKGKLHRAISVFLFRKNNNGVELLIQQRSREKLVGAMLWANTVCGHVLAGESYLVCSKRRLDCELGIRNTELSEVFVFQYQVRCDHKYSENEIDHVFVGWYDGQVKPNPEEVAKFKWQQWGERSNNKITPWFDLMLSNKNLVKKINNFLKL
jgi:isopentenyl-diphosphate Delta-isomerase